MNARTGVEQRQDGKRARYGVRGAGVVSHVPVLLDEVLHDLAVQADGRYVDATFGRGGHSRAILDRLGADGSLLALDTSLGLDRTSFLYPVWQAAVAVRLATALRR